MGVGTRLFIALHVWLYRLSRGRIMGRTHGAPILLLTTTGRKSGRPRTVPLLYLESDGAVVLVASSVGGPRHPAWYLNLEADPKVNLQVGRRRFDAVAWRASPEEGVHLWSRLVALYPPFIEYQKRTRREFPIVIATPGLR